MGEHTGRKLVRQLTFIKENTTGLDGILDRLIQNEVIPLLDREAITMLSPKEQMQKIIDIVLKKEKVHLFLLALKETGNDHVVEKIKSCELPNDGNWKWGSSDAAEVATQTDYFETKLSKENENLRKEIDDLREENTKIKHKYEEAKDENNKLKEENDHLKRMQKHIREETNKKHEKYTEMNRQLQVYKAAAESTNTQTNSVGPEEMQSIKDDICNLYEKNCQTGELLVEQELKRDEEIHDIRSQLLQFKLLFDKCGQLEEDNKELRRNFEDLKRDYDSAKLIQNSYLQQQMEILQKNEKNPKQNFAFRQNVFPQPKVATTNQKPALSPRRPVFHGRRDFNLTKSKSDIARK